MRTIALVSLGVAALLGTAGAANAQQVTDWSGFYAGIYGGYGLDREAATSSTAALTVDIGGALIDGTQNSSASRIQGIIGGLEAGYLFQHNNLVLGVETGLNLGQYSKSRSSSLNGTVVVGANTVTLDSLDTANYTIGWYTDLVGRVGVAHGNWLFSLKGGVVVADASIASTNSINLADPGGVIIPGGFASSGTSSISQLLIGPTFGVGVETMIADNISISGEYSYVGLPDLTAPAAGLGGFLIGGGGAQTFSGGIHQVKAGVKYHF